MSHYGPQPGQPQEPWVGPQSDGYDQPSDPWGGQNAWGTPGVWSNEAPSSVPPEGPVSYATGRVTPGHEQPGYGPAPGGQSTHYPPAFGNPGENPTWTTLAPPPKKKSNAPLVAFVVVLALLVLGGGGVAVYLLGQGEKQPAASPTTTPQSETTDGPSAQPTPSDEATTPSDEATTSAPDSASSVRLVEVGECVKNEGTTSEPKLVITECGPKTYEVLARIDGSTTGEADAKRKCSKVPEYDNWYFFKDALDDLSFVLCLKQR
ncbi:MAG TPA: flagellar basal body protein FliL [Micromonospora sp.]|nr:flagellar basal body protein FliL [Micromonospora sp.]